MGQGLSPRWQVRIRICGRLGFCVKCLKSVSFAGGATGQHRGLSVRARGPDRQRVAARPEED